MTVNELRFMEKRQNTYFPKLTKVPLVVLYQKMDSEKVEKQSTRWRNFWIEKRKLCNSVHVIVFLVA